MKVAAEVNSNSVSAVEGTQILDTQVGGHRYGTNGKKLGMLDRGNGIVLKALQPPPRGTRELNLYQTVFAPACSDKDLLELRNFLPLYYGKEEIDEVSFLVMNNLTHNVFKPNVLDLKIGPVSYDPEASPQKQQYEMNKYPPRKEIGFVFAGMMTHDPATGKAQHYHKKFYYSMTPESILREGLGRFFGLQYGRLRKDVVVALLQKLHRLKAWFQVQRKYTFYASSLLIVYSSAETCDSESSITIQQNSCTASSSPEQHVTTASNIPEQHGTTTSNIPEQHGSTASSSLEEHGTTASNIPEQHGSTASSTPERHGSSAGKGDKVAHKSTEPSVNCLKRADELDSRNDLHGNSKSTVGGKRRKSIVHDLQTKPSADISGSLDDCCRPTWSGEDAVNGTDLISQSSGDVSQAPAPLPDGSSQHPSRLSVPSNKREIDLNSEAFVEGGPCKKREVDPDCDKPLEEEGSACSGRSKACQDAVVDVEGRPGSGKFTGVGKSGPPLVEVRMIDFAHVFPSSSIDSNYLLGLQKLIDYLEQLLTL